MNKWSNLKTSMEHWVTIESQHPEYTKAIEHVLQRMKSDDFRETEAMDMSLDKNEQIRELLTRMCHTLSALRGFIVCGLDENTASATDLDKSELLYGGGLNKYEDPNWRFPEIDTYIIDLTSTIEVVQKAIENMGGVSPCYETRGTQWLPMDIQLLRNECECLRGELSRLRERSDRELLEGVLDSICNRLGPRNNTSRVMRERDTYEAKI
jgi:hypothetical protein